MSGYHAPIKELMFCLEHHAGAATSDGSLDLDMAQAVIEECGKFAEAVLDPLNAPGDQAGASWNDGVVTAAPGFKDAFRQFAAGGWTGLQHPEKFGGQGLPKPVFAACLEIVNGAN